MLSLFKEVNDLPRASAAQHEALYRRARQRHTLSQEECEFLRRRSDCVTLKRDLIHSFLGVSIYDRPNSLFLTSTYLASRGSGHDADGRGPEAIRQQEAG